MDNAESPSSISSVDDPAERRRVGLDENRRIANHLGEIASLLESQHASEFRVSAYRKAAGTLLNLQTPVRWIDQKHGIEGLIRIETVGQSIARLIDQYLRTGRVPLLDRLRGEATAERIFTTLPTIGPELAHRIYDALHVETLPELYSAAIHGKLGQVPGIGRKRAAAIEEVLAERLRRNPGPMTPLYPQTDRSIPVAEILDVDAEYRRKAEEDKLPKVAPTKFNPGGVAWLPILHTQRDDRHYTALYSNSARAHELNTTKDWVVIYRDDDQQHGRWTVITSQFGKLHGCRIIRGREDECRDIYLRSQQQNQ
ncbi:helix-hairpin-helix domain-containing protein [Stieleria sp. ICT_E10.1]|uniref:helix-hairpin-helix domain-containing protein n=1 Tax=Stieleria sedimenti TaxID=2976331 RepID=UPI00217F5EE6|nr:helix-hairpin-helix domain-containing protein [Stieleria sedimenti]MCS7467482.1 helix-hairpin-helix domain-containing protein [Stieleria sedimenti]